jgi:3-isopropylmalate/(R)-2-methylmalate dehydratase small subunit
MDAFTTLAARAAPLPLANVDTDVIIRIERLTKLSHDGLGRYAFESLRYLADGSENPDFVLNQPDFRGAPILVAGPNFGCGSSREGAVWALKNQGLRCVIASSFGDIFYDNCFQNGVLPVKLAAPSVDALMGLARSRIAFEVDLEERRIRAGDFKVDFDIDPWRRDCLLQGLDGIEFTLRSRNEIVRWQLADRVLRPWVWPAEGETLVPTNRQE